MFYSTMIVPNLLGSGRKIAIRQSDRLHALAYWTSMEHHVALWGVNDFRFPRIETERFVSLCPEFTNDNRLVVSGYTGYTPVHVYEFGLTGDPLPILNHFEIGNANSRWGASCSLRSGVNGLVFCNYQDVSAVPPGNELHLDTYYRLPMKLPGSSGWAIQSFRFPGATPLFMPFQFAMCEGPDGLIWLFYTRDSNHCLIDWS
jgi:hypothetical protein